MPLITIASEEELKSREKRAARVANMRYVDIPSYREGSVTEIAVVFGAEIFTENVAKEALRLSQNGEFDHLYLCGTRKEISQMISILNPDGEDADRISEEHYTVVLCENMREGFKKLSKLSAYKKAGSMNIIGLMPKQALAIKSLEEKSNTLKAFERSVSTHKIVKLTLVRAVGASKYIADKIDELKGVLGCFRPADFEQEVVNANKLPLFDPVRLSPQSLGICDKERNDNRMALASGQKTPTGPQ